MKNILSTLLFVSILLVPTTKLSSQVIDCFIIDNPTASTIDIFVVAKGGSFLTQQWNDMMVTLHIPTGNPQLGNPILPGDNTGFGLNTYQLKGFIIAKDPTNVGTAPSYTYNGRDYFKYNWAGLITNFQANFINGQDATLPENVPVFMGSIPKNGNNFSDVQINVRSALETDPIVSITNNSSYYIEINNLEFSGDVYKYDIVHFNNRLNQPPVTPQPRVWRGGSGTGGEANMDDASRDFVVFQGPVVKNIVGAVSTTTFIENDIDIIINSNAGFQTTSFVNQTPSDSVIILASVAGYGQYIGPSINGSIQQYIGTNAGYRNLAIPVSSATTTGFSLGGAPINLNALSTSYHTDPATRDICGNWGGQIGTVNVYTFTGATGNPRPHEWYGAASIIGGTRGYSVFAGSGSFPTSGLISVKGAFNEGALTYPYAHEAPHATNLNGASQHTYIGGPSCSGATAESTLDRWANWDGWALVANPYPCNLNVDAFSLTNGIDPENVRIWDRSAGTSGLYIKRNGQTIPPMQAFWVKSSTAGDDFNILFNNSHRTFDAANFMKSGDPEVILLATNNTTGQSNHIKLKFNPSASKGYDKAFDTYVMSQPGNSFPQLAFHNTYQSGATNVVAPLDVNTVPYPNTTIDSYDLRFWARSAGNFSFTVDKDALAPGWEVFIEDLEVAPGVRHNVTHNAHNFAYSPTSNTQRFVMHFVPNSVSSGDWDPINGRVFAYGNANGINVGFNNLDGQVVDIQITNELGQILYRAKHVPTDQHHTYMPVRLHGLYIVTVTRENGKIESFKVVR